LWEGEPVLKIYSGLIRLLLLISAVAFGVAGIYAESMREQRPENEGSEVEVFIAPGLSAGEIAGEFERAGAVTRAKDLAAWMARLGIDRRIKPGVYRVTAARPKDVASQLAELDPEVARALIIPGAVFEEIAASLGREDGEILLDAALGDERNFPEGLASLLPARVRERMIFMAPDTYAITPGDSCANELVKAASAMWWKRHGAKMSGDETSADLVSAGILASIVQKEALVDSDRPIIAGVFKNRLEQDMPLQSCATVVYAWRLAGRKITTVSYNDVKIDSPFNTYVNKGLPPENIGAPAENSWNAALEPADTDMLFFFAKGDGSHVFTRTYKEHLQAQKKFQVSAP
jgi:UPF0755 protein